MRRTATALAVLASLALPAHAAAQVAPTPTPTPPPVVPTPTPTPTPAPLAGKITLSAQGTFNKPHAAVLKGHSFTVRGVLRPYVAGEKVVLRVYRNGKKVRAAKLTLKPVPGNQAGVFTFRLRGTRVSRLAIKATHDASPLLATVRSKAVHVQVVSPSVAPGERGPAVRLLQSMLARLHYAVPFSGVYDAGTQRAVVAWRKVVGASRNAVANSSVFNGLIKGRGRFHVRHRWTAVTSRRVWARRCWRS